MSILKPNCNAIAKPTPDLGNVGQGCMLMITKAEVGVDLKLSAWLTFYPFSCELSALWSPPQKVFRYCDVRFQESSTQSRRRAHYTQAFSVSLSGGVKWICNRAEDKIWFEPRPLAESVAVY